MPKFNMDRVVTSQVLPLGYYDCITVSFEEAQSKSETLMFVAEFRVNKPEQFRGKKITERFNVGKHPWNITDKTPEDEIEFYELDDPQAEDDRTVARLMRPVKSYAESAGWERAKDTEWDTDDLCEEAPGLKVGIRVVHDSYNGRTQHKTGFFYPIGTHEAAIEDNTKATVPTTARATKKRTRAVVDLEDED